jgi:RNA polymerase sigma factor for flagellar operon FliA
MTTTDVPPPGSSVADRSHNSGVGPEFRLRELWRRYAEGDETARDNLVLNYAPLVKVIAGRVGSRLPPQVEVADLIAYGLTGLMGAIERYDPERGIQFKTFALTRIRGAMIDALRTLDWVPRSVRANARELERAESGLAAKLGRPPDEAELAAGIGVQVETLRERLLEITNSRIYSFDAPLPGRREEGANGDTSLLEVVSNDGPDDPQEALDVDEETGDLRAVLGEAIHGLPEQEQFVLSCRYREDLRLAEIGEVMGLSESRVSQLHTKALISLRAVPGVAGTRKRLQLAHSWN